MEQTEVENEVKQSSTVDFDTQLEESLSAMNKEDGQLVNGTVVQITSEFVFLDVGCKSEGRIPLAEFSDKLPKIGDKVQVFLERQFGRYGPEISKSKADIKRVWKTSFQAYKEKSLVSGKIIKTVKGGFEVSLGGDIHAFLPISQSDLQKVEEPETLIGTKSKFYIERFFSDGKPNVVVNRRKYLEEESERKRDEFFKTAKIGDTVRGVVKSFTSFGAFVDLGGFDGLLHINDMSWGHVAKPRDFVKKDEKIELKLIRLDPEEKRINLSLKHFTEDPWIHFEEKFHVDDIVEGTVTKFTDFGAFVELSLGIEGLVHISEFSWTKKINKPSDMLKVGQKIKCMILGYDIQAGRVSLGIKQTTQNPWDSIETRYPVGSKVKGKIVKVTGTGAFINLEEGIDSFLYTDDISWTKKVKHPGSVLKEGEKVEAIVLDCIAKDHRIKVGMKQVSPNPWEEFARTYKAGSVLEGEITSITDFGVFVRSPIGGIEGLINKQNLTENKKESYEDALKRYKVGDKITVYVIDVNVQREKVAFSVRELKRKQERDEISRYMAKENKDDDGAYTLGDFIRNQNPKKD